MITTNDIATLDMARTIAVTEVRTNYGYRYRVTLLLNGRPTSWDSGTYHHTEYAASKYVTRFRKNIDAQFAKIIAINDINERNAHTDAPMWDYVFDVSDNPNVRARTLRCCFDNECEVLS